MTIRLNRLIPGHQIINADGTPTVALITAWQRNVEAIEQNDADNDALDTSQTEALDVLNDALTRANAAYELIGPGAYSITSSQTLPTDCRTALVDTSGGAVTVTLNPVADSIADVTVKKLTADANNVTIDGDGAETIDGAATVALTAQYQSKTVRPALGAWHVVGVNP